MPPISLRVTPIHHLAEVCVGNPYWIFNEREYNAIQSQWVCQCPRLHTHTHTPIKVQTHIPTHTHTQKKPACGSLCCLRLLCISLTELERPSWRAAAVIVFVRSGSHTSAAVWLRQRHNKIYEPHPHKLMSCISSPCVRGSRRMFSLREINCSYKTPHSFNEKCICS